MTSIDERTILIIEDEYEIRGLIAQILEEAGYETIQASDGSQALILLDLAEIMPALILTDIRMSPMDGWEFLSQKAKSIKIKEIPVLIVSADGMNRGFDDVVGCFKKPFDAIELLNTISSII